MIFQEHPKLFLEHLKILVENLKILVANPRIFVEHPRIFLENRRIFFGKILRFSEKILGSIYRSNGRIPPRMYKALAGSRMNPLEPGTILPKLGYTEEMIWRS